MTCRGVPFLQVAAIDALVCKSAVSVSVTGHAATHRTDQTMSCAPAKKKKDVLCQQHTQIVPPVCVSRQEKEITAHACEYAVYLKVLHALLKVLHALLKLLHTLLKVLHALTKCYTPF